MSDHTYRLYSIDEIQNWPEPEWLIHKILPKGGFTQLYGEWGSGKTFVVLDWALSIAAGIPWADTRGIQQGPVIYVFGEGRPGVKQRVNAWLAHNNVPTSIPFRAVDMPPQLTEKLEVNEFIQDVLEQLPEKPTLMIFDTLARSIVGADEDKSKTMGIVVAAADEFRRDLECTTMIVHHSGYGGRRGRGSSVVPGGLDTIICATKKPEDMFVNLTCDKQKNASRFDPIKINLLSSEELDDDGDPVTLVASFGGKGEKVKDTLSTNAEILWDQITKEFPDKFTHSDLKNSCWIPTGSLSKALKQLKEKNWLKQAGPEYYPQLDAAEGDSDD